MIGDEYLQIRAQLGTALFSLSTLAHGLHAGRDVLQILHELRGDLREPFHFLVAGEEKSGKSSLINALFGREIVAAGAPLARDKIHIFKHGLEEQDLTVYGQFIEHRGPNPLLRDFNIVDTPGSSIITHDHLATVDNVLPVTDLVLFVFSITNPWDSPSWDFLNYLATKPPRNIVFVLQQCDLRDAPEVEAIATHLEKTILEKFPRKHRVFAVSAKKAYLSKTTAMDKEGLFQQSNFGALESYINDISTRSEERMDGLRSACRAAQTILRDVAEKLRSEFQVIDRDAGRLAELNLDLEERRDQTVKLCGGVQWGVAQSYERMQKRGEDLLQQGKAKRNSPEEKLRPPIDTKLEESIPRRIQSSMELLENDLRQAWPELHDNLRKRFPAENSFVQITDLLNERTQLLRRLEISLADKKSPQYYEKQIPVLFAGLADWLQVPAETIAMEGTGAFITALTRRAITDFYTAFEAATAMQGKLSAIGKGNRILAQFRWEMACKREELLATLDLHLRNAAGIFYREVAAVFQPLENFCSKQRMIYEPRLTLVNQMEETLDRTGASLGIPSGVPVLQGT